MARALRAQFPLLEWTRLPENVQFLACWSGAGPGTQVQLFLQRRFRGGGPVGQRGYRSISKTRIPDIVLVVRRGDRQSFFVFDAKYTVSRASLLEAMTSAHVYQDSLWLDGTRPERTLLVIPRGGAAGWLERDECHERHRVGIVVASPGADLGWVERVLRPPA